MKFFIYNLKLKYYYFIDLIKKINYFFIMRKFILIIKNTIYFFKYMNTHFTMELFSLSMVTQLVENNELIL